MARSIRLFLYDRPLGVDVFGESITELGKSAMGSWLEAINSPVYMGENDEIPWEFQYSNWGTPVAGTVNQKLVDDLGNDLTSTNITGVPFITDDTVIVCGTVFGIERKRRYRLYVWAETTDGPVFQAFTKIYGEDV